MPTRKQNPQRPNLEGVGRTHPIVPIVLAKNNHATNANLPDFLEHQLSVVNRQIPYTLCEFYGNYLEFVIQCHVRHYREQYGPRYYQWNIRDAINRLSKLAYLYCVRAAKITQGMVTKQMAGVGLEKDYSGDMDIEFRSLGLLVQDGVFGRRPIYRFREPIIMEYLVANYHLLQCLKSVTSDISKSSSKVDKIITGALLDSMKKLPLTGDIWRITFGLLNADVHTKGIQGQILSELIDVSKCTEGMSSFDVTSLCVEAIYESQNAGELTKILDEFTMNQTINYSNAFTQKSRIPYTVQAAGYLVRASPDVYGLHLANFGLNEERVALLADPINAVSDNNLQVLNLSTNSLGASGMRRLQRFIVKASLLTHLDMSLCELDRTAIAILSEFFMCLPLRYLNLADNYISDAGLIHMSKNLKYVPTLEVLSLARNQLTDKSIVTLGECVRAGALPNLRSVDVSGNSIGAKGIEVLSKAIPALHYIEDVKVAENTMFSRDATELIDCMWKSKSLKHINMNINDMPPEGVLALTKLSLSEGESLIPMADEESDFLSGDDDVQQQSYTANEITLNSSHGNKSASKLNDSQNVSLCVESGDKANKVIDLLEGRPDRVRAVNLRHSTSRSGTLPRMKDVRRSWHGLSTNLRESMRNTRENLSSRSSLRDSIHMSNGSLRNSLRRSSNSLRDSMQNTSQTLRESFRNTGANVRDSLRKRFGRQSPNRTRGSTIETSV